MTAAVATRAACFGHPEPLWDANVHGETVPERKARQQRALAYCHVCPITGPTGECARRRRPRDAGVWGGQVWRMNGTWGHAFIPRTRNATPRKKTTTPRATEPTEPRPRGGVKPPAPCGTTSGYKRHIERREPTCAPCRAATAAAHRARRARLAEQRKPRAVAPCGTRAGYRRHRRNDEPACEPCTTANREYLRDLAARNRTAPVAARRARSEVLCGTPSGRTRHARRREQPCDECKAAQAAYQRSRRALTRAACGTRSGYFAHLGASETPCQPCTGAYQTRPPDPALPSPTHRNKEPRP